MNQERYAIHKGERIALPDLSQVSIDEIMEMIESSPRAFGFEFGGVPIVIPKLASEVADLLLRKPDHPAAKIINESKARYRFSNEIEASAHNPKTGEIFVNPATWDALNDEEKIEMLAHECRCLANIPAKPDGNS